MGSRLRQKLIKINTARLIVQFLSFLFFSAIVFNISSIPILLPVLWTWGLQQNAVGDALTAIQFMFGGWNTDVVFPWLGLASFLIIGVLLGKSLCGWICPFGFIQDLLSFIRRKKTELALRTHESLLYAKYLILGITLFVSVTFSASKVAGVSRSYESALGIFTKAPFTALSPAETLFAIVPNAIRNFIAESSTKPVQEVLSKVLEAPAISMVQILILASVLIFAAYVPRGWCKYLCPHGALMALLNRFSFLGLRRDLVKCAKGECRLCVEACPMRVRILDLPWEKMSDPECIYCMKCADACPNKAIRIKYP
ncbi:MAG: 4Fe-4S binding protein [Candidatus Bathyarchaeia archaeon]